MDTCTEEMRLGEQVIIEQINYSRLELEKNLRTPAMDGIGQGTPRCSQGVTFLLQYFLSLMILPTIKS